MTPFRPVLPVLLLGLFASPSAFAGDWPQFLGPNRNLIADENDLDFDWPKSGPNISWRTNVGRGFAGVAVRGDRLILFHREDDEEVVAALDPESGEHHWEYRYPTAYRDQFGFDEGPRATPVISGDVVVTHGADGRLTCLGLTDGALRWSVNLKEDYNSDVGFFGPACSPVVEDGLVLLQVGGGKGRGLMAFDLGSGEVRWSVGDMEAGYASPVVVDLDGARTALFFHRDGLTATAPDTGRVYFEFPWRASMNASVNAASPVVSGNRVFLSASYGLGAVLLRVNAGRLEPVWQSDARLSNHYATSVHWKGMLIGFHGRADIPPKPSLRAIDFGTGKLLWEIPEQGPGTVLLADDHLLVLTDRGELLVAPVDSKGFRPVARAQILSFNVRAYPALADGRFFARSDRQLVCVDLGKSPASGDAEP